VSMSVTTAAAGVAARAPRLINSSGSLAMFTAALVRLPRAEDRLAVSERDPPACATATSIRRA
jgi:hypothetical protein